MGNIDGKDTGIYRKFIVERANDPQGKHDGCEYFVLDWYHDPFTIPAVLAYADACEARFPLLAADLRKRAEFASKRGAK